METSNKFKAIFLLTIFICLACAAAFGQGPGFEDDVVDTPIDGGATLMLAAAAGYGYKKIKDARNKKNV
ncbi:MAG: hypothetical protein KDC11_11810 [Chitinophagaceae bacterium]|nr:hypothetical protein [Chitinophagaceae bacterium]